MYLLTSCELFEIDNKKDEWAPNAQIYGAYINSITGDTILQDRIGVVTKFRFIEKGWIHEKNVQLSDVWYDGSYRNNLMYEGLYDFPVTGWVNFKCVTPNEVKFSPKPSESYVLSENNDTIKNVFLSKGENHFNFYGIPYLEVRDESIEIDSTFIGDGEVYVIPNFYVKSYLEAKLPNSQEKKEYEVKEMRMWCHIDKAVGCETMWFSTVTSPEGYIRPGTDVSDLKIRIGDFKKQLLPGHDYYFRIGVKTYVNGIKELGSEATFCYNYSNPIKVTMPNAGSKAWK